ncbi:DNA primase family protein [Litorimonas sp. WD9-15]|uniref:DNA primase family protein n=1 Tax=Litorimonas sp. WD9-15 TaxID=3418716 RepID=UPI003D08EE57
MSDVTEPPLPPDPPSGEAVILALVAEALHVAVTQSAAPVPDEESSAFEGGAFDPEIGLETDPETDNVVSLDAARSAKDSENGASGSSKKPAKKKSTSPKGKFTAEKPPSDALLKRAKLDCTDLGIAQRLVKYCGGDVRFCPDFSKTPGKGWAVFDKNPPAHGAAKGAEGGGGRKFHLNDGQARATRRLTGTVRTKMIFEEFPALKFATPTKEVADGDPQKQAERGVMLAQAKSVHRAGKNLGNSKNVKSALEMARTLEAVLSDVKDWDRDPFKINTPGGMLTLPSVAPVLPRGESIEPEEIDHAREAAAWTAFTNPLIQPVKPEDLATRITIARLPDLPEDGSDPHPHFTKVLEASLPDPDTRATFQRACGSCLTSKNPRNNWFLLKGKGSDGKSTLMRAIRTALGDYARSADVKTFLYDSRRSSSGPREDLMALSGALRMAVVSEPETGAALSDEILKMVTGGDQISARGGHQQQSEFVAQFKLFMMCNEAPKVRGDDNGTWRRPLVIEFPNSVPVEKQDSSLEFKLAKETDAILLWLFQGALDWWSRGFDFAPSERVKLATESWRLTSNDLAAWSEDRLVWGKWHDMSRVQEESGTLFDLVERHDATRMTDDLQDLLDTCLGRDGKSPKFTPTEIWEDYQHWAQAEAKDPWNSRGFAMSFARMLERNGGKDGKSNGSRVKSGFTFRIGFPQSVSNSTQGEF